MSYGALWFLPGPLCAVGLHLSTQEFGWNGAKMRVKACNVYNFSVITSKPYQNQKGVRKPGLIDYNNQKNVNNRLLFICQP